MTANCPSGKSVVGGGYDLTASAGDVKKLAVVTSKPAAPDSWTATADETTPLTNDWSLTVYALCVSS
ncbi:MAG TPA: hypothetical protein VF984_03380 [Actinomycetota bacterium]